MDAAVAAPITPEATVAPVAIAEKHFSPALMIDLKPLSSSLKFLSIADIVALKVFNSADAPISAVLKLLSTTPLILMASSYSFPFADNFCHLFHCFQ
jgi:hypothetical protein